MIDNNKSTTSPSSAIKASSGPTLPWLLATPLTFIPSRLHSINLTLVLNRVFASEIQTGDLNFLQGRVLAISIRDAGIKFHLTFSPQGFRSISTTRIPHLTINGNLYDFMLLATRREDPDTLFFNRRLSLDGNAELGLYVKNFLDALEWEPSQLPLPWRLALQNAVPLYEWIMSNG